MTRNIVLGVTALVVSYLMSAFIAWDWMWMTEATPEIRLTYIFIAAWSAIFVPFLIDN